MNIRRNCPSLYGYDTHVYDLCSYGASSSISRAAPEMIAMVHIHSTTAILNHGYTPLLKIPAPTPSDVIVLNNAIQVLNSVAVGLIERYPIINQVAPVDTMLRSAVFLLNGQQRHEESSPQDNIIEEVVVKQLGLIPFIKFLVDRAVEEVTVYVKHGIRCVEVENVAAPYFIGAGACPWEELIILYLTTRAIRLRFPSLMIGMHILSANELEVLPIGIACGAYFVRSEATLFQGIRPEGETNNNSNMARYLYVRQTLRNLAASEGHCGAAAHNIINNDNVSPSSGSGPTVMMEYNQAAFPQIWSDVKKKHTVFFEELQDIDVWLHNINFMKLEAVIVTGAETGSDVDEESLKKARKAVESFKQFNEKQFGVVADQLAAAAATTSSTENCVVSNRDYYLPHLPLVTGSGLNFEMYRNYADYCIVGTALKVGNYWENEVSEANVERVVATFKAFSHRTTADTNN